MKRTVLIFTAIILGLIISYGHHYTFLIRYNLMVMLFFAFLDIKIDFSLFSSTHFKVLAANATLPILFYLLLQPYDNNLAMTAMILALIPTGVAAPVFAEFLKANVGKVTVAVLLTNPLMVLLLPLLLTFLIKSNTDISIIELLLPVLSLVFIPLILSQILQKISLELSQKVRKFNGISFPLFLMNLVIGCGNASHFIQSNADIQYTQLAGIILLTSVICVLQFQLGAFIGRKYFARTFGLALGRKNTMLGLWIALTYLNPIVALGPIFYIIIQNIYNAVQLWQLDRSGSPIREYV